MGIMQGEMGIGAGNPQQLRKHPEMRTFRVTFSPSYPGRRERASQLASSVDLGREGLRDGPLLLLLRAAVLLWAKQ